MSATQFVFPKRMDGSDFPTKLFDIPADKNYPADALQCDDCGGNGCGGCEGKGWLPAGHPKGRKCMRDACSKMIPPDQVAVYCSNDCAFKDA